MGTDMSTEAGVQKLIREAKAMQNVFDRGLSLMEEIFRNPAIEELGINMDEIKREAAQKIETLVS